MRYFKIFFSLFVISFFISCSRGDGQKGSVLNKTSSNLNGIFLDSDTLAPNNKKMIIIFDNDGCKYCDILKNDIKNDKNINQKLRKFSAYKLNVSEDKSYNLFFDGSVRKFHISELRSLFRANGTPTIVFFDEKSDLLLRLPGYLPAKTFNMILDFVLQEQYEKTDINKYLEERG